MLLSENACAEEFRSMTSLPQKIKISVVKVLHMPRGGLQTNRYVVDRAGRVTCDWFLFVFVLG